MGAGGQYNLRIMRSRAAPTKNNALQAVARHACLLLSGRRRTGF
jgi:hypothetical protein